MRSTLDSISIDLPPNFLHFSKAERKAWLRAELEATALEMLADIGEMVGMVPTAEQRAAYLLSIQPGIDLALGGTDL